MVVTISVELNDKDYRFIKRYADINNISITELFKQTVIEKIEDETDHKKYKESMSEHNNNPITFSHKEVKKILEPDLLWCHCL